MNRVMMIFLALAVVKSNAQQLTGKVIDALTNQPLGYANIFLQHQNKIFYTDSLGSFYLAKDSLYKEDSIYIQYLGYKKLAIAIDALSKVTIFKMVQQTQQLQPVVVTNCRKFKEYFINRRAGKIRDYLGPGPETKFVIIGHYLNTKEAEGFIKQLEIYTGNFNARTHVPVRVHWYDWDSVKNMPGRELTSVNIVIYPYQQGWNSFKLPANTIYFSGGGIAFGLEFIYPVEYMQQYDALPTTAAKATWLMDMKNRWSLGIQATKDATQTGYYQVNNLPISKYSSRGLNLFIKPALRFTVTKCLE